MRHSTTLERLLAVGVLILLTGCGGGGGSDAGPATRTVESPGPVGPSVSSSPSPSPSPSPSVDPAQAARRYIEALATGSADKMQAMIELAAPGSSAQAYAVHQQAQAAAAQAEGIAPEPNPVTARAGVLEICRPGFESSCSTFGDFQVLPNGQVVSFTIDGKSIESRLIPVADRPAVAAAGVSARLVSAYRSVQTEELVVAFEVRNDTSREVTAVTGETRYVGTSGRQSRARTAGNTVVDVQPGALVPLLVFFPEADPGGTLTVVIEDAATNEDIASLKLPVK